MKRILTSLVAVAVIVGSLATSTGSANAADPLKIGVVLPLGGAFGDFIKHQVYNPMILATNDRNAKGGVLGRKIELVVEDTKPDAVSPVAAMRKLIDVDKVNIILTASTPVSLPLLPIAEERKILVISSTTESPDLTKSHWAVRGTPVAGQDTAVMARVAFKSGYKTAVVLSDTNEAVGVSVQSFANAYQGVGGKILDHETFNEEDTDLRGQLTKLSAAGADALLIMTSSGRGTALAYQQMSEVGFHPKQIYSNVNVNDSAVAQAGVTAATEGTIFASAIINEAFKGRFAKTEGYDVTAVGARTYDGAVLLYNAIQKAGSADSTKVRDTIYNYGEYDGVSGKYVYRGSGQPDCTPALLIIKNGKAVPYRQ
jgi:branched-chain amino acid transport system substrate-binding protein